MAVDLCPEGAQVAISHHPHLPELGTYRMFWKCSSGGSAVVASLEPFSPVRCYSIVPKGFRKQELNITIKWINID